MRHLRLVKPEGPKPTGKRRYTNPPPVFTLAETQRPISPDRGGRLHPAIAAGVVESVWTLADLMTAALAEQGGEKPTAQPLTIRRPEAPARELPGGRGWLQLVKGGDAPAAAPAPATPPAASMAAVPSAEPDGQLDLFAWTPKARPLPPPGTQLDLFDDGPQA